MVEQVPVEQVEVPLRHFKKISFHLLSPYLASEQLEKLLSYSSTYSPEGMSWSIRGTIL